MTEPNENPLREALMRWQEERGLTNSAMADRLGITESYWKAIRGSHRGISLEFARLVYHRFTDDDLAIRLFAKRFTDEWFGATPEAARAAGAD